MILRILLLVWLGWAAPVHAHSLTLSVLQVKELREGEFVTRWQRLDGVRDPASAYLLLRPSFPSHCRFEPPRLSCGAQGLAGRLGFLGLGETGSSGVIQIERLGQPVRSYTFDAERPQRVIEASGRLSTWTEVALGFVWLGVEHIWLGWDHLAFVLGLLWLVRRRVTLIQTITAFTVAHSVTLGLATLGYTSVPTAPVEATIALSIAFVAVELVRRERDHRDGLTARAPWAVAFAFGLLHGLGFANALSEIELAVHDIPAALLGFNVGVELGQMVFVAVVLLLGAGLSRRPRLVQAGRPLSHYALGTLAMYWFFERVTTF